MSLLSTSGEEIPQIGILTNRPPNSPEDLIGIAIGLSICIRTIGGSIGYAILYNVFVSHIKSYAGQAIAQSAVAAGMARDQAIELAKAFLTAANPTSPTVGSEVTQDQAILSGAHLAYQETAADASKLVYYASIALGAVVIVCCAALPQLKKFGSNKVLA